MIRAAVLSAILLAAVTLFTAGCAERGNPVGGGCPVVDLTLPPGAVQNKLPDGICPPEKDKRGTRSLYCDRTEFYTLYSIAFDLPGGIEAVKDYYKLEAESIGFDECFDTSQHAVYKAGYHTCTGRKTLFVSPDKLSAFCVQRTKDFAEGAEHEIGEFLLTAITIVEGSNSAPRGSTTF